MASAKVEKKSGTVTQTVTRKVDYKVVQLTLNENQAKYLKALCNLRNEPNAREISRALGKQFIDTYMVRVSEDGSNITVEQPAYVNLALLGD